MKLPILLGSFGDALHGQGIAAKRTPWLSLPSPHSEPQQPCRWGTPTQQAAAVFCFSFYFLSFHYPNMFVF